MNDSTTRLDRALGLKEATALNMIDMVGIGPFIVVPMVVKTMGGPEAIAAWIAGAVLALIDGMVWAELGASLPLAGGSYAFLRESYGEHRWGKLMSFLFIWQTMIQAPLVIASGAIGFSQYAAYLIPVNPFAQKCISAALVALLVGLLYRHIGTIGKMSLFLWIGVVSTIVWLIWGGVQHFDPKLAFGYSPHAWDFSPAFFVLLGQATVQTIYTYLGYYNVCHLGGEIRNPERNIPRAILLSIIGIAVLYLAMQLSILGTLHWQEIADSPFVVSTFVERIYGTGAATIATVMILWIAFASLFSALLGYSRIPYAAAVDGAFFAPFAKLHPTKHFPHVSLLALGGTALVFSLLFRLSDVISAILAMRILVQFIGQAVGAMVRRRRLGQAARPFSMPLYPLPAILAALIWGAIFLSTGERFVFGGSVAILLGIIVFFVRARVAHSWPFES